MSSDSRVVSVQETPNNTSVVTYHSQNISFAPTVSYTSSLIINLQQLQNSLHTQYHYEKNALTELNKHFRVFLDHVQFLESQNSKYIAQLADLRRQTPNTNYVDSQWDQSYLHLQSDLVKVNKAKLDYEFEIELFDVQSRIYRQLIDIEQQWKDDKRLKLEQILKNSQSELNGLRISYSEMEQDVERLSSSYAEMVNKYLRLSEEWALVRKQTKEWELNSQMMKNHIIFYKNIRTSSTGRSYDFISISSDGSRDFWAMELNKSINRIRRDFELLYGTLHREMVKYYEVKSEETEREFENLQRYRDVEYEELIMTQQTLHVEYEKVQQTFTYEREVMNKLELTYSKLESDFKAIQQHNEERFEMQSKELYNAQERVMELAYDIDDIRRKKVHLEAEIIIYRHLLGLDDREETAMVISQPPAVRSEMVGKYMINNKKKGSIGIKECAPNGAFIALLNHSTNKDIDVSRWTLVRRVDSTKEYRYILPDGTYLRRGEELRIYSKTGMGNNESGSQYRTVSGEDYSILFNRELVSWGNGNRVETLLFNQHGEEKASYLQTAVLERKHS